MAMDLSSRFVFLILLFVACVDSAIGETKDDTENDDNELDEFNMFVQSFLAHLLSSNAFTPAEKEDLKAIVDTVETVIAAPRRRETDFLRKMQIFNVAVLSAIAETIGVDTEAGTKEKANAVARALSSAFGTVSDDNSNNKQLIEEVKSMVDMFTRMEEDELQNSAPTSSPSLVDQPSSKNDNLIPRPGQKPPDSERRAPLTVSGAQVMGNKVIGGIPNSAQAQSFQSVANTAATANAAVLLPNSGLPQASPFQQQLPKDEQSNLIFQQSNATVKADNKATVVPLQPVPTIDWDFLFCLYNKLLSSAVFSSTFTVGLPYKSAKAHTQQIAQGLAKTVFSGLLSEYEIFTTLNEALLFLSPNPTKEEFAFMFSHELSQMLNFRGLSQGKNACDESSSIVAVMERQIANSPLANQGDRFLVPNNAMMGQISPQGNLGMPGKLDEARPSQSSTSPPIPQINLGVPVESTTEEQFQSSSFVPTIQSTSGEVNDERPFQSSSFAPTNAQKEEFESDLLTSLLTSAIFYASFPAEVSQNKLTEHAYALGKALPEIPNFATVKSSDLSADIEQKLRSVASPGTSDQYARALIAVVTKLMKDINLPYSKQQAVVLANAILNALSTEELKKTDVHTTTELIPTETESDIGTQTEQQLMLKRENAPVVTSDTTVPQDVTASSAATDITEISTEKTETTPAYNEFVDSLYDNLIENKNFSKAFNEDTSEDQIRTYSLAVAKRLKDEPNFSGISTSSFRKAFNEELIPLSDKNSSTYARTIAKSVESVLLNKDLIQPENADSLARISSNRILSGISLVDSRNSQEMKSSSELTTDGTTELGTVPMTESTDAGQETSTVTVNEEMMPTEPSDVTDVSTSTSGTATDPTVTSETQTYTPTAQSQTNGDAETTTASDGDPSSSETTEPLDSSSVAGTTEAVTVSESSTPFPEKSGKFLLGLTDAPMSRKESLIRELEEEIHLAEQSGTTDALVRALAAVIADVCIDSRVPLPESSLTTTEPSVPGDTETSTESTNPTSAATTDETGGHETTTGAEHNSESLPTTVPQYKEISTTTQSNNGESTTTGESINEESATVTGFSDGGDTTTAVPTGSTITKFPRTDSPSESTTETQANPETSTLSSYKESEDGQPSGKVPKSYSQAADDFSGKNNSQPEHVSSAQPLTWLFQNALSYSLLSSDAFTALFKPEISPSFAKAFAFSMAESVSEVPHLNFDNSVFRFGHAYYMAAHQMHPNATTEAYARAFSNATAEVLIEKNLLHRENQISLAIAIGNAIHDALTDEAPRKLLEDASGDKSATTALAKPFDLGKDASTSSFIEELLSAMTKGDAQSKQQLLSQTLSDIGTIIGNKHLQPKTILIKLLMEALVAAVNVIISESQD